MTRALVAINHTTYGGVYYSDNIDFDNLATQPTWTRRSNTGLANLLISCAQYDVNDPYGVMYVQLTNNDVYKWNGSSWTKIMDMTIAGTLTGTTVTGMGSIAVDTLTPGTIYCPITKSVTWSKLLKSTDYGANWSVVNISTGLINADTQVQAHGQNVIISESVISSVWAFSTNGGSTWAAYSGGVASYSFRQDTHNPTKAYGHASAVSFELSLYQSTGQTTLQNGYTLGGNYRDTHWVDPVVSGHERILKNGVQLFTTYDGWTTLLDTTPDTIISVSGFRTTAAALENSAYIMFGDCTGTAGIHHVRAMNGEAASSTSGIAGTNYNTSPYTDAIPGVANVIVALDGIFVGEGPADAGVFVYADELGDITDVPSYDGLGIPEFGDRASFRDLDADDDGLSTPTALSKYHAQDIHADTPQRHAPWSIPAPGVGYGIVSDGAKWVISSDEIALEGDIHDAVTLDSDAAVLLDLQGGGQEIGLDTQSANTVFAGPATGAANEPTFRALVKADLPAIALDDLSDVDMTGVGTGDIMYKTAGNYEDYPLGIGTQVINTGSKIKLGDADGTSFVEIDTATGNVRLAGNATAWEDLRVSADVVKPGATAPNYKAFGPSGSLQALMFEASHHDEVHFEVQMPHAWKLGSKIYPHVHWTPTTADAGNVVWELEYAWSNIDSAFDAPGNMASDATAAGGTAWMHKLTRLKESGNDYIDGTGKTLSSMIICRLHRNSNAGSDTLNKDVAFLEIDFHFEIDSFGSDTELVKDTTSTLLLETGDHLLLETGDKLLLE